MKQFFGMNVFQKLLNHENGFIMGNA
jgi:hypothetical protein